MRTISETSGSMLNTPTFESQESHTEEGDKKKGDEKILEELIVETSLKWGRE